MMSILGTVSLCLFDASCLATNLKISRIKSNHDIESEVKPSKDNQFNSRNKSTNPKVYTVSGWINNKLKLAEDKKLNKEIYGNSDYNPNTSKPSFWCITLT
jgi:hypothetical protein